jgi:DNA-binding NtrC family response regulator
MIHADTVLIVHNDAKVLARLAGKLATADVGVATTFEEAKAVLAATPIAVLITGARLGDYNGLHLIIRARIDHPLTAGIVISDGLDPTLEGEAAQYGAACVSLPEDEARLLLLVAEKLSTTEI